MEPIKPPALDWKKVDHLVSELTKKQPDERQVEELMTQVGLSYDRDPVSRMGTVLELLDSETRATGRDHESSL